MSFFTCISFRTIYFNKIKNKMKFFFPCVFPISSNATGEVHPGEDIFIHSPSPNIEYLNFF